MKRLTLSALFALLAVNSGAYAATGIAALPDFLMSVENAKFEGYRDVRGARVESEDAFERMRKHILNHYRGVMVAHSFVEPGSRVVDCVTIETQPSLQTAAMLGHRIATPPKPSIQRDAYRESVESSKDVAPQLGKDKLDPYMNPMYCNDGTIPLMRLSLALLARHATLDEFFRKVPGGMKAQSVDFGTTREPVPGDDEYTHYWAKGFDDVENYGGDSRLNLWKPNADPGWFSLSQQWYVGGSGSDTQTVEGGWQVADRKYDNTNPHLFIYSTSADYADGSGCYNLECAAFVQINNNWVIGGQLGPVSTLGGTQYIFRMQWQYYEGNWWLFLMGRGAAEPGVENYQAIGYYPEEHFDGGQLTKFATRVQYGGEVASLLGDDKTGEMGSGRKASDGWRKAAYQRTIYYIDTNHSSHWAALAGVTPYIGCYTVDVHNQSGSSWATYLYFGGEKCPAP